MSDFWKALGPILGIFMGAVYWMVIRPKYQSKNDISDKKKKDKLNKRL